MPSIISTLNAYYQYQKPFGFLNDHTTKDNLRYLAFILVMIFGTVGGSLYGVFALFD